MFIANNRLINIILSFIGCLIVGFIAKHHKLICHCEAAYYAAVAISKLTYFVSRSCSLSRIRSLDAS